MADLILRMISRRNMLNESYIEYYYEKMGLIQRVGFEGEDTVDLLADGISYPLIKEQASGGVYKTPKALLKYLSRISTKNLCLNCGNVGHHISKCRAVRHSANFRGLYERHDASWKRGKEERHRI